MVKMAISQTSKPGLLEEKGYPLTLKHETKFYFSF